MVEEALVTCYGPGSIAGAIIGTLLITFGLAGAILLLYNIYWRSRKGKHLVLVSDVENPEDHYAFDNPNFREATPIKQNLSDDTKSAKLDLSWLGNWSPLHAFSTPRTDKQRSLDDTFITDSQLKIVSLKSHDFTGLGFSVCGNMRDGIFVKDLLHRGPAFESGCINPGDRIDSICISFRHMVFEDALTILSYASPYEVQIQVERSAASRPSTLVRKRDNSSVIGSERILHPFYRSQSIADIGLIDKNSGRKSNERRTNKSHESNAAADHRPMEHKKENLNFEKRATDATDGIEHSKHPKFGVKVLPMVGEIVGFHSRSHKDSSENEQNSPSEQTKIRDDDTKDVKTIITKGLQNLKEKINQNTIGRKKKEDEPECREQVQAVGQPETSEIPYEVARAGEFAQNSRKSVSAESLAARRPASEIVIEIIEDPPQKKSKGKAPPPPAKEPEVEEVSESKVSNLVTRERSNDSDSETEDAEMTCTQVTVHHSPVTEDQETGRKAASLGDLSRLEDQNYSGTLERAVSLDLDASHGKKRKAPQPPEDFEEDYRKEPRLEGYSNTFQRKLKKSSEFGRLEDALSDCDDSQEQSLTADLSAIAAHKIQEFSSWLEEVRKPQEKVDDAFIEEPMAERNQVGACIETNDEVAQDRKHSDEYLSLDSNTSPISSSPHTVNDETGCTSTTLLITGEKETRTFDPSVENVTNSASLHEQVNTPQSEIKIIAGPGAPSGGVTFSVNGLNLQESSGTVLLISQPNSLELEEIPTSFTAEEETPPELPSSPPPSSSLSYVTEIQVSQPNSETTSRPIITKPKPIRKDISPETSRIPVRTMKSETGQKVLAAIQSLAVKELSKNSVEEQKTVPTVAGFYLKKVPPVVPPRKADTNTVWSEKEKVNGTPRHVSISTGVNLPVKTSATKIIFESQDHSEEF